MLIKVCGMKYPENIIAVDTLDIEMIGFIFYDKSPRFVNRDLPDTKTSRVGVFVNQNLNIIRQTAIKYHLNYIQLHGNEPAIDCNELRQSGYKIIKAVSVATAEDIKNIEPYYNHVDFLLFDTKCIDYGGSGQKFDWTVLNHYDGKTPFILSGGINPESLGEIKSLNHPSFAGIDLNSGFEDYPALKNPEKLKTFISKIKDNE